MANLLTAVPSQPPPRPAGAANRLVWFADLFMIALVSRPSTGTLRTTWVTPATLALAAASVLAALLVLIALVAGAGSWPALLVVIGTPLSVAFGFGAGAVVAVGVDQRRQRRRN